MVANRGEAEHATHDHLLHVGVAQDAHADDHAQRRKGDADLGRSDGDGGGAKTRKMDGGGGGGGNKEKMRKRDINGA